MTHVSLPEMSYLETRSHSMFLGKHQTKKLSLQPPPSFFAIGAHVAQASLKFVM